MGIASLHKRDSFGLEELGLLEDTPFRPIDTIVDLCTGAVGAAKATFIVFDTATGSLFLRSSCGLPQIRSGPIGAASRLSASALVASELSPVSIESFSKHHELENAMERTRFGVDSYLGAPVFGPVGEVLGVLATMSDTKREWTKSERGLLSDFAYLLSEQVMLRAALTTVKLMAKERSGTGPIRGPIN